MADSRLLVNRMVRAAKLDPALYDEVAADASTTGQAVMVVFITSLIPAFWSGVAGRVNDKSMAVSVAIGGVAFAVSIFIWLLWSVGAYWWRKRAPVRAEVSISIGSVIRAIGFASSPKILSFFVIVPYLGLLVGFAATIWFFVAGVVATQRSLGLSPRSSIIISLVVWLVGIVVSWQAGRALL